MVITYQQATPEDIAPIYELCKQLIYTYENLEAIDVHKVMNWVQRKIESSICQYTAVYANGQKAGYYHFYQNEDGQFELDDLYVFPQFQNQGIGTAIIEKCCASVASPVMLYVFIKNHRAVALYQRLGFTMIKTVNDSRYIMQKNST